MVDHLARKIPATAEMARGVWVEDEFELRPALVTDFDGTIRRSKASPDGFVLGVEDVELLPNAEEKLWEYRNAGYLVFGVSNQGGVAYGHKSPADAAAEMTQTLGLFRRNPFHGVKLSLNMPGGTVEPYAHRSLLRKPDIGMLALLEVDAFNQKLIVDWDHSVMVGDRDEDRLLSENAGMVFYTADEFFGRTP